MTVLRIKMVAYQNAPKQLFDNAERKITTLVGGGKYSLVEQDPHVLFFLSGGAEEEAVQIVKPQHFYILVGSRHGNSWSAASEVKAYLNQHNIPSMLLDEEDSETPILFRNLLAVLQAIENLKGKRLGLIGKVSGWLVASGMPADVLKSKFGIELQNISWADFPHFSSFEPSKDFLGTFSSVQNFNLTDTARVYQQLNQVIESGNLDAVTVECFPLVKKDKVTACLPLARFNDIGVPAGCEGDLTAIAGMMLCQELTGIIPWIANINKISEEGCMFSHCTIATNMVSGYSVMTHYETDKGTAIAGQFKSDIVTVFRFDNAFQKAFVAVAQVTGRPQLATACRTQIEVKLAEKEVALLRNKPLGNHHLLFPGDCRDSLVLACMVLNISVLE
jgi:L-fucose isomerase-like protein